MEKILIVDDEKGLREVLSIMLKRAGYVVTEASDGEEAIGHLGKEIFDLVITDLRMPGPSGLDLLEAVRGLAPDVPVIRLTAYGTVRTAVEAMR